MILNRFVILLFFAICLCSCEKDDICDPASNSTTPRLVLEFFDFTNPTNLKSVVNLKVKAIGAADFLVSNETLLQSDPSRYLFNDNKIKLPLKIDQNTTKYSLVFNSSSNTLSNEDFLEYNYSTQNVYISRACGYKTIFSLNANNGVIQTDGQNLDSFWIKGIAIQTNSINDENTTHIKIYF